MSFQYEVDGSIETHDYAMPVTTACPYLPGQTVNTLSIPVEQALRQRSASLSSMREEDLKTLNPEAKFITPRPVVPLAPLDRPVLRRLGSSPLLNRNHSRPSSPAPAWKRFFSRRLPSRDGERGRTRDQDEQSIASRSVFEDDERSTTPSEGTRTRDISPESLRRFLSDETVPARPASNLSDKPAVIIPDDIVEEVEDDENFATSAISDGQSFSTYLSPPPFKRTVSSDTLPPAASNSSVLTLIPSRSPSRPQQQVQAPTSAMLPSLPKLETLPSIQSPSSPSCSSVFTSPTSPQSPGEEVPNFYDSTDDDDDILPRNTVDSRSFQPQARLSSRNQTFEGYSLPRDGEDGNKELKSQPTYSSMNSPQLFARANGGLNVSNGNFLGDAIDTGLDDFASELGWMVDVIGNKRH